MYNPTLDDHEEEDNLEEHGSVRAMEDEYLKSDRRWVIASEEVRKFLFSGVLDLVGNKK